MPRVGATQMDFPVEATVHLNYFQDVTEVLHILRSHGFRMVELSSGQVHIKGYFSKLVDVQARLERLRQSQTRTTPSPDRAVSPGAVPKYYNDKSRPQYRDKYSHHTSPLPSSPPHSRPLSRDYRAAVSPAPSRPGTVSFAVDADAFRYAKQFRKKDIDTILSCHNVERHVQECDDGTLITLQGKSSKAAANKLQELLGSLTKSLRTQEVPRSDMDHEGTALLEKIRRDKGVYGSVLLVETSDGLHLIGPSGESYELKQRLLGKKSEPPRRTGRSFSKSSGRRSSSLPPNRSNTRRDDGVRARGFSPQRAAPPPAAAAAPPQAQSGASRRRSFSESHTKEGAHLAAGAEKKHNMTPKKILSPLLNVKSSDFKQFFRMKKSKI